MSDPHTSYASLPDTTEDKESRTLGDVYRFVLDCHAKNEAAPESRLDDAKESKNVSRQNHHSR